MIVLKCVVSVVERKGGSEAKTRWKLLPLMDDFSMLWSFSD